MNEQNLKSEQEHEHPQGQEQLNAETPIRGSFIDFEKEDRVDTFAWYLVVFGFITLGLAALCFYLRRISYRDFSLNGNVLGNYLLMVGICLYIGGRGIKYYKRYKRKAME